MQAASNDLRNCLLQADRDCNDAERRADHAELQLDMEWMRTSAPMSIRSPEYSHCRDHREQHRDDPLAIEEEESQQHGLLPQMMKKKPFISHGLMKILSAVSTQMLPLVTLKFLPGIFALCATYNPLTHNLPTCTDLPSTAQLRIAIRMKTSSL